MIQARIKLFIVSFVCFTFFTCENYYLPKPRGHIRLEYPEGIYSDTLSNCGYSFQKSNLAIFDDIDKEKCWSNLRYPKMNAEIFITYFQLKNNLDSLIKDAQKLTYQHSVKASYIKPKYYENELRNSYAVIYDVGGNVASNIQFHVTDSVNHFLVGSLYFKVRPNYDSLQPAIDYLKKDIKLLIESLEWN